MLGYAPGEQITWHRDAIRYFEALEAAAAKVAKTDAPEDAEEKAEEEKVEEEMPEEDDQGEQSVAIDEELAAA